MKEKLQGVIIGGMIGIIVTGSIGVFAAQYTANDNPFPITYNGRSVSLQGYNIDGNTYFKLRDIADVVGGFNVGFENNTIILTSNNYSNASNSGKDLKPYKWSSDYTSVKDISIGGKYFKDVVCLDTLNEGLVYYNLDGKFNSINGLYGSIDDDYSTASGKAVVRFYGDGKLLQELDFVAGQLPKEFNLSVNGVSQLMIEAQETEYCSGFVAVANVFGK